MLPAHILDASALIALFAGHRPLTELLYQAMDGEVTLVFPAVAVADANAEIKGTFNEWNAVLSVPHIEVCDFAGSTAIEIGGWPTPAELAARHALFEAQHMKGVVVTCAPEQYAAESAPVFPV